MKTARLLFTSKLVACALAITAGASELKTVVYPVVFGDLESMETFARTVVADDGHVVLDPKGSRLIVITTPERHEALNAVLGMADARTGNVRIEVRFRETGEDRDTGAGVRAEGDIVFGPGGVDSSIVLRPELRHTVTEMTGDTRQILMTASGREAVLRVGESVPHPDWITEYGWHGGYTQSRVQWQEVGSFLVVTPTIMPDGETIHVRLTPELRGLVDGHPQHTRFTALATEIIIRDGATMSIGGSVQDKEFYSRYLIGVDRSGTRRSMDIELTPQIVHAERP